MSNYKALLPNVKAFVFDYDGVFTEGTVILTDDSEPMRTANVKDGYAVQLAIKLGYRVAIISGGKSKSVLSRFRSLNVPEVFLGVENKLDVFNHFLEVNHLHSFEVVFMGDDIPDYKVMLAAGVPTCPSDAAMEIKSVAAYISRYAGGKGCVREIIEQVLKSQGKWMQDQTAFSW